MEIYSLICYNVVIETCNTKPCIFNKMNRGSKDMGDNTKREERNMQNIIYLLRLAFRFSKSRVINSLFRQIISSLLWVFYSAYFVRFVLNVIEREYPMRTIFVSIGIGIIY